MPEWRRPLQPADRIRERRARNISPRQRWWIEIILLVEGLVLAIAFGSLIYAIWPR